MFFKREVNCLILGLVFPALISGLSAIATNDGASVVRKVDKAPPLASTTLKARWSPAEEVNGIYYSELDGLLQAPTLLTHFLDATEERMVFIMSQAFALQSNASRCPHSEKDGPIVDRPYVNINKADSFRCVVGDSAPRLALIEGYSKVDLDNADKYHMSSTFAVSCSIDAGATSIRLQRYDESGSLVVTYRDLPVRRSQAAQNRTRMNLAGCLLFNAAYSSWSMLFAQLAFQRLQGFDHTIVYDNTVQQARDDPEYRAQLEKLKLWQEHVTHVPWVSHATLSEILPGHSGDFLALTEYPSYAHCQFYFRGRANWIANNHVDEFVSLGPDSTYQTVVEALQHLGSDVGSLYIAAQEAGMSRDVVDPGAEAYFAPSGRNVVGNEDLLFTLASKGHVWHTKRLNHLNWEGIYRPEALHSLHCQWGDSLPGFQERSSDPKIGVVTQHFRTTTYPWKNIDNTSRHGDGNWYEEFLQAEHQTSYDGRRGLHASYEDKGKTNYEEMRWFGRYATCVRRVIETSGSVPSECR
jgi:hypothetical protein